MIHFKSFFRYYKYLFPLVLLGLVVGVTLVEEVEVHPRSSAYVFDVGQGDGMLVKSKEGVTVLIDGGPTGKITEHLDSVLPYRDREIDYMIATHPHADHVAGLVNVLEKFHVRNVIITGVVHTTDVYLDFLLLLKEKRCPTSVISTETNEMSVVEKSLSGASGTQKEIPRLAMLARDDERNKCIRIIVANGKKTITDKDVTIELLWPLESLEGKTVKDAGENAEGGLNDTSVVSRITLEGATFLFPGDAGFGVERKILESETDVQSDVLMLAHHGSKTASSEEWLKAVDPDYAMISAGQKNKYKLPAYITVRRVERLGIPIYRTDQDGTLEFLVEDGNLSVETER